MLDVSPAILRNELKHALYSSLLTGHNDADEATRAAVVRNVCGPERRRRLRDVTASDIESLLTSLHALTSRPEMLRRIAGAVMYFLQRGSMSPALKELYVVDAAMRDPGHSRPRGQVRTIKPTVTCQCLT